MRSISLLNYETAVRLVENRFNTKLLMGCKIDPYGPVTNVVVKSNKITFTRKFEVSKTLVLNYVELYDDRDEFVMNDYLNNYYVGRGDTVKINMTINFWEGGGNIKIEVPPSKGLERPTVLSL